MNISLPCVSTGNYSSCSYLLVYICLVSWSVTLHTYSILISQRLKGTCSQVCRVFNLSLSLCLVSFPQILSPTNFDSLILLKLIFMHLVLQTGASMKLGSYLACSLLLEIIVFAALCPSVWSVLFHLIGQVLQLLMVAVGKSYISDVWWAPEYLWNWFLIFKPLWVFSSFPE